MAKKFPKNPFMSLYKPGGAAVTKGMHRPEGAGNFDNMDDHNIVNSVALNEGTIQHTPANAKDIANKAYVDAGGGGGGGGNNFWTSGATTLWPIDTTKGISGANINISGGTLYSDNGNVGMGITTPTAPLHIKADSANMAMKLQENSGTSGYDFVVNSSGDLILQNHVGSKAMKVDNGDHAPGVTKLYRWLDSTDYWDGDTYVDFTYNDMIQLYAGNINFLRLYETTQDIAVFNEDSNDIDFRWESNIDPNALFFEGSTGNLGLATSTPNFTLDVSGAVLNCNGIISGASLVGESDPVWLSQSGAFMKFTDDVWVAQSGAYITDLASGALYTIDLVSGAAHFPDTTDPHGADLTQTNLVLNSGAIAIDNDSSGAAVLRNVLIGVEATPGPANLYPQGTIYMKYTA